MGWVKLKFGGGLLLGITRQGGREGGEEKKEVVGTQKLNKMRRAGLVFLAVELGEPVLPRAALGTSELRAGRGSTVPPCASQTGTRNGGI